MTMKQTLKTLMELRQNGVNIFLTDEGWSLLVRITAAMEDVKVDVDEQVG